MDDIEAFFLSLQGHWHIYIHIFTFRDASTIFVKRTTILLSCCLFFSSFHYWFLSFYLRASIFRFKCEYTIIMDLTWDFCPSLRNGTRGCPNRAARRRRRPDQHSYSKVTWKGFKTTIVVLLSLHYDFLNYSFVPILVMRQPRSLCTKVSSSSFLPTMLKGNTFIGCFCCRWCCVLDGVIRFKTGLVCHKTPSLLTSLPYLFPAV